MDGVDGSTLIIVVAISATIVGVAIIVVRDGDENNW